MTIANILRNKVPDYAEVEVFFFEHCNLKCVHCFQDHSATVGMSRDSILSKATLISEFVRNAKKNHVVLNIMGGELFQDHLLSEFLPVYTEFIEIVSDAANQVNKTLRFNFVTNLLATNHIAFIS